MWATNSSGVRVYLEGFRVLPYGEPKDDWLSIDADYTRRPRQLEMLKDIGLGTEASDPDIGLVRVPSNNYFGAVFLTQSRCPDMRLLVNREGFVPEASFDTLGQLVRMGIDFLTRERAAASFKRRQQRRADRRKGASEYIGVSALPERIREAALLIKNASTHLTGDARSATNAAMRGLDEATVLAEDLISERMLLYVLASVGTQMAAFVHEINALLGATQTIEHALESVLEEGRFSREQRRRLRQTLTVAVDLKRGLERQAAYLNRHRNARCAPPPFAPAFGRTLRRRSSSRTASSGTTRHRHRQSNSSRIEVAPNVFRRAYGGVRHLLTNAVKAAGEHGRICASASSEDDQVRIRIQNTGTAVQLDEAERWFKPFESTTSEVDPVLGQGMGLGLTITRNLLENYGAFIKFVQPTNPFATAVEVALPSRS